MKDFSAALLKSLNTYCRQDINYCLCYIWVKSHYLNFPQKRPHTSSDAAAANNSITSQSYAKDVHCLWKWMTLDSFQFNLSLFSNRMCKGQHWSFKEPEKERRNIPTITALRRVLNPTSKHTSLLLSQQTWQWSQPAFLFASFNETH